MPVPWGQQQDHVCQRRPASFLPRVRCISGPTRDGHGGAGVDARATLAVTVAGTYSIVTIIGGRLRSAGTRPERHVEITVTTARRIAEVLQVRSDCLRRYRGLPMFWHYQTKVGSYDAAIRIPPAAARR